MPSPQPDRTSAPAASLVEGTSTQLALEHYDPRPIRKVPIDRWRDVFSRSGSPPGLANPETATLDDVVTALTRGSLPTLLHDLLQVLHDMGTTRGAHVLNEAAVELGIDRSDWPEAAEELAVEVWARARGSARYRKLLLVAEVGLHERTAESRYREYFGREPGRIEKPEDGAPMLQALFAPWFREEKMGGRVKILLQPEDDRVVFCIFHGTRRQYEATFDDDGSEGMVGFRPLVCDVVTYEHITGRLRITARSKRVVELYQAAFGAVFFDDDKFFSGRPRYQLGPLAAVIEAGALPPPSDSSDVHGVHLVDCVWTAGGAAQHHVHGLDGRDCTQQVRRAQFRAEEDQLTQATLAFTFLVAGRLERTEIVLRTGNQFDCRKPGRRDAIEEYLTKIGVRTQAHAPDQGSARSASLSGVHPASRWQLHFGDRLAEACSLGVLRPADRSTVGSVGESEGTDRLTRIDPGGGAPLLLARDAQDGDVRLVRADEIAGYELDPRRLAELVRDELRCGLSMRELPFRGGYDLGPIIVGSATVRPFLLTMPGAVEPRTTMPTLTALAGEAKWIVVLPPGTSPDAWGLATPLRALLAPFRLRTDIIRTLGLEHQVTALERADGRRLVVDTKRHTSWLDETPLFLSEIEWQLLEVLARAAVQGQALLAGELARTLCDDAENKDLVRQRVHALSTTVRGRLKAEGKDSPESDKLVRSIKKGEGYRLALVPYVE